MFEEYNSILKKLPPIKLNPNKKTEGNRLYPICFYNKKLHKLIFYFGEEIEDDISKYIQIEYNFLPTSKEFKQIREWTKVELPKPKGKNTIDKIENVIRELEELGIVGEDLHKEYVRLLFEGKKLKMEKEEKMPIKVVLQKIEEV